MEHLKKRVSLELLSEKAVEDRAQGLALYKINYKFSFR